MQALNGILVGAALIGGVTFGGWLQLAPLLDDGQGAEPLYLFTNNLLDWSPAPR